MYKTNLHVMTKQTTKTAAVKYKKKNKYIEMIGINLLSNIKISRRTNHNQRVRCSHEIERKTKELTDGNSKIDQSRLPYVKVLLEEHIEHSVWEDVNLQRSK